MAKGYSKSELESAWIRAGGNRALAGVMAAIAKAESGGGASPYGDKGLGGSGFTSFGPWQIHTPAHPQYDPGKLVSNLDYSARAAVEVSGNSIAGLGAWTTFKTGAYKPFLVGKIGEQGTGASNPITGPMVEELRLKLLADPKFIALGKAAKEKALAEIDKGAASVTEKGPSLPKISALESFAKVGETLTNWISEPLTPIKFLGGAVILYIGVRTLTGGTGAAREASRATGHVRDLTRLRG